MCEMGHSVVLMERGGYHPKETFTQKEDEMIPLLYKNAGFQFCIPAGIAVAQGSCVGGSTVVNDAVCFRAPDAVLGWWADKFKVEDIEHQSMKKYFEKVEARISVSEVQPYELNANNLVLKRGCEKLGWEAGPNSRNCKNCRQCGMCQIGCSYGTKQSMLETYIKDAEGVHGDLIKIYSDCAAEKLVKSGSRITGVVGNAAGKEGRKFEVKVKPKLVIVSAGTIASSEILLRNGLDSHGKAGKGIAIHPSPAMIGDFDDEINGNRGIPMAYHCTEFSVMKTGKRGYMLESVFLAPFQFCLPIPGVDYDYKELMARYSHFALGGVLVHDDTVGSVQLGGPLGSTLNYQLSPGDEKLMIEGMKSIARIFFAAGATRVLTSHRKRTILYGEGDLRMIDDRGVSPLEINLGSGHPQGGNRMGGLPGESVVDSHSKFNGVDNMLVCDASVFPTSLGVNPQLTVMALAMRAAEHIGENWNAGRGYGRQ